MHCGQCTMRNSALSNNTTVGSKYDTKGYKLLSYCILDDTQHILSKHTKLA